MRMCLDRLLLSVYFLPHVAQVVVARSRALSSLIVSLCDLLPSMALSSPVSGMVSRASRRLVGATRGESEPEPESGSEPVVRADPAVPGS